MTNEAGTNSRSSGFYLEILLASLALVLLEISYTRVFSYKLFYYFTYLIIGIALLGMGSGGIFVSLFARLRETTPSRLIAVCCLAASASVPAGYVLVSLLQLNTGLLPGVSELLVLAVICSVVFFPFLMVGIVISTIFGARPEEIGRLYFADLIGAGIGCALCVPLLWTLTPPGAIMASGLALALAALRLCASEHRGLLPLNVLLVAGLGLTVLFPGQLPDPVPDQVKTMGPQQLEGSSVLFSRWNPVFRIDVTKADEGPTAESRYWLNHDGMLGSSVLRFNGDLASMADRFERDTRSTPFGLLDPAPKVMIIGSAGGHEILTSLYFGAESITAVELNPVTVSLLTRHFADFTGRIAMHDKVDLQNDEGRTFVMRDDGEYDLIWFVAPDSYSAMNAASSGAFVLSESYLYTVEMIKESLAHLSEDGVLCVQFGEINFDHKPNRTARYLATAREAYRELGIEDFESHVLLSTTPEFFTMASILLKNTPFTDEEVRRFRANAAVVDRSQVLHAAGRDGGPMLGHPVNQVISLSDAELERWMESYPYDVSPVTDDSPFFWHFARFRDAFAGDWTAKEEVWDPEDATGERVLITLLVFAAVFAAVFLLLPLLTIRRVWSQIPYKGNAVIYFAALGLGFMFFEVCLIQQLTLFLGYPTYSLTVTIFSLLIFTGIGSLATERYANERNRALYGLLGALVVLMLWLQFGLPAMASAFVSASFPARVALTVAFIAPLGLVLGAFMPIGLTTLDTVTEHGKEFIAWGWAVNGFFSVMSSILATILSMTLGFKMVLLVATLIYAAGIFALTRIPEFRARES